MIWKVYSHKRANSPKANLESRPFGQLRALADEDSYQVLFYFQRRTTWREFHILGFKGLNYINSNNLLVAVSAVEWS